MDPNLKQRIIDEAYVLFLTKGMKQTSFCDVAAAVHKSKGAVMRLISKRTTPHAIPAAPIHQL